jgi:hypothetical protein
MEGVVTVIVPVADPLQVASVFVLVVVNGGPALTVTGIAAVTQPDTSVTTMVCTPAVRFVKV